jgi:hypothetical protein
MLPARLRSRGQTAAGTPVAKGDDHGAPQQVSPRNSLRNSFGNALRADCLVFAPRKHRTIASVKKARKSAVTGYGRNRRSSPQNVPTRASALEHHKPTMLQLIDYLIIILLIQLL